MMMNLHQLFPRVMSLHTAPHPDVTCWQTRRRKLTPSRRRRDEEKREENGETKDEDDAKLLCWSLSGFTLDSTLCFASPWKDERRQCEMLYWMRDRKLWHSRKCRSGSSKKRRRRGRQSLENICIFSKSGESTGCDEMLVKQRLDCLCGISFALDRKGFPSHLPLLSIAVNCLPEKRFWVSATGFFFESTWMQFHVHMRFDKRRISMLLRELRLPLFVPTLDNKSLFQLDDDFFFSPIVPPHLVDDGMIVFGARCERATWSSWLI